MSKIIEKAKQIVSDDRQNAYGDPTANFVRIAERWSQIFGVHVSPEQVGLAMIDLKMARLVHDPSHEDSLLDIVGYALCIEKIRESK